MQVIVAKEASVTKAQVTGLARIRHKYVLPISRTQQDGAEILQVIIRVEAQTEVKIADRSETEDGGHVYRVLAHAQGDPREDAGED